MNRSVLARLVIAVAAAAASLTLSPSAFAAEVYMDQVWDGQRFRGEVFYVSDARSHYGGEGSAVANNVTISRSSPTWIVVRDKGRGLTAWWGWFGSFGCFEWSVSEPDGTYPASCHHPNGFAFVEARLGGSNDSLRIDSSVPPTVTSSVYGEAGDDELDTRGGSASDVINCGSGFDWVYYDPDESRSECESESLGGQLTSAPAVSSWGPGYLDIFWRGASMDLRHRAYSHGWHPEESLGGVLTSEPDAVIRGPGKLAVVGRALNNSIYMRVWENGWQPWSAVPSATEATSGPAVAANGHWQLHVLYRGAGNRVMDAVFGSEGSPYWTPPAPLGGDLEVSSAPTAVSWGTGRIDLFARGGDGALYHKFLNVDSWSNHWTSLGGQLSSGPAVASRGYGELDVFVRGMDNALYRKSYSISTDAWSGWQYLGGKLTQGDPAAVSWGDGRIDLFTRGPANELYHMWLIE